MEPTDDTGLPAGPAGGGAARREQTTLDPHALRALDDLVGGDVETLHEITRAFLDDAPERIRELREGLETGDDALVRRSAHTLKSTALTFGAGELGEACRQLEEAARTGRLDEAQQLTGHVEAEWARTRPAVEALLR